MLGNLGGGPVVLTQRGDQARDHAGFADVPGMSANYDEGHG
jgi:hypothetical protein